MTTREELHRRALLHDQAAALLQEEADRHKAEARKLQKAAVKERICNLWVIIKQIPLRFRLWRLESKIPKGWDRDLSFRIDAALCRLEKNQ